MTPQFDTGDNPNRGTHILAETVKTLVAKGYTPLKGIVDSSWRTCCYLMKDPRGNFFYLVARSTEPYAGQYFGSQTWLVKTAVDKDVPFVLATPSDFYVFDGEVLLRTMKGTNIRDGQVMGNFSVKHGLKWDPTTTKLYPLYRSLQYGTHEGQQSLGGA